MSAPDLPPEPKPPVAITPRPMAPERLAMVVASVALVIAIVAVVLALAGL